jgi:hypothetical protein
MATAGGAGRGRVAGSGATCRSREDILAKNYCDNCRKKKKGCTLAGQKGAAGLPAEAAVAARTAPKRDAVRNIKENSPSKKLLKSEEKYLRRGESTAKQKHNREQLGQHLSKLASGT